MVTIDSNTKLSELRKILDNNDRSRIRSELAFLSTEECDVYIRNYIIHRLYGAGTLLKEVLEEKGFEDLLPFWHKYSNMMAMK